MGNSTTLPPSEKPEVPAGFLVDFISQQRVKATPEETEAVQVFAQRLRVQDTAKLSPYALLAFLNLPVVRRQMRARQFTRDVIDTLGYRILEVKIPSPMTSEAETLADTVRHVMATKAELKREIASIAKTLEPVPTENPIRRFSIRM